MYELIFEKGFKEDLAFWKKHAPSRAERVLKLVEAVQNDPIAGIGKPEHLRHFKKNMWSRRITQEHRCVYWVNGNKIHFLQCRFHY